MEFELTLGLAGPPPTPTHPRCPQLRAGADSTTSGRAYVVADEGGSTHAGGGEWLAPAGVSPPTPLPAGPLLVLGDVMPVRGALPVLSWWLTETNGQRGTRGVSTERWGRIEGLLTGGMECDP